MINAGITYFTLFRTVPPISADPERLLYSWPVDETIVVSETGAILSPNKAPEIIAPPSTAGLHPMITPTGYKIGVIAATVPKAAPVAKAKAAENKNAVAQNAEPDKWSLTDNHTSPSTNCPFRKIVPYIPTISQIKTAVIAILSPKPTRIRSQYISLFLQNNIPMIKPITPDAIIILRTAA